jgi:hypothetical protein
MDRMTIVGDDGQDRIVVEGDAVADLAVRCAFFDAHGYHQPSAHLESLELPVCCYCNQTLEVLRLKGETIVY